MNRDAAVERTARALYADYRTKHPGLLTWETEPHYFKLERFYRPAHVVVDALLPQVTTVEELEALPVGSLLVAQSNSVFTWRRPLRLLQGLTTGYDYEPADVLTGGPLTVVYQP